MYSKWLGEQAELIRELTLRTFNTGEFGCVFVVCKNPELMSLLSCIYSKSSITKPYSPGTNLYIPVEGKSTYRRVKVCRIESIMGVNGYYYEECKGTKSSVCTSWKPAQYFESHTLIAKDQQDSEWIYKRDIRENKLDIYSGKTFPTIVSTRNEFENTLNIEIEAGNKLIDELGFSSYSEFINGTNFISRIFNIPKEQRKLIWINSIPDSLLNRNQIVYISPFSYKFDELKYDIKDLALHSDGLKTYKYKDLPNNLATLAKKYSSTTSISIWGCL
ncbi:hypothetical protein KW543_15580 [Vibrio fluvialis]|nr:hypothetical protein [Vibrio fluvialis]